MSLDKNAIIIVVFLELLAPTTTYPPIQDYKNLLLMYFILIL